MKEDIIIVIPTYMRETKQKLYESMPNFIKDITYLCTHSGRHEILKENYPNANIIDLGLTNGIADVRQKIFNKIKINKFIMCDDGVSIHKKILKDDIYKYTKIDELSWKILINEFSNNLDNYAQCSIIDSAIAGFYKHKDCLINNRIYSITGINKNMCIEADTSYDYLYKKNNNIFLGEDFYFSLKLLTEGYENYISTNFSFSHSHNKPGGNSLHRTEEMERISFEMLQEEFPTIIKHWKEYNNSWDTGKDENGNFRWKTRISWKNAINIGKTKRYNKIDITKNKIDI